MCAQSPCSCSRHVSCVSLFALGPPRLRTPELEIHDVYMPLSRHSAITKLHNATILDNRLPVRRL